MRFIGVSDAHTDDVATLSGANVRRDVNSTMTASPANLKTKTSSPAERQVVDKITKTFIIQSGIMGEIQWISNTCDGLWHLRTLKSWFYKAMFVPLDSSFLMATSGEEDSWDLTSFLCLAMKWRHMAQFVIFLGSVEPHEIWNHELLWLSIVNFKGALALPINIMIDESQKLNTSACIWLRVWTMLKK